MRDIVERLRRINAFLHVTEDEPEYDYKLSYEAADEIERLRNKVRWLEMCENTVVKQNAEIEWLREALKEIADAKISGVIGDGYNVRDWLIKHHVMLVDKARAALKEGK